jgi:hypothetical protein
MKAATRGNWDEVWGNRIPPISSSRRRVEKRKAAKNAAAANEDEAGGDMFSRAGVAAE